MEIVFLILSLGAAAWAVRERAASRRLLRRLGEMLEHMGLPLVDESILALAETFFQRLEESGAPG